MLLTELKLACTRYLALTRNPNLLSHDNFNAFGKIDLFA
jgi:hypothetical protein